PALAFLREKGLIDDDTFQSLKSAAITPSASVNFLESTESEHIESISEDRLIKGKTTFADLYSWDVTKEEIEEIIGSPAGARAVTIRDYCTELGLEFGTIKTELQTLIDEK
ncbi:MAG: hypothetical protein ISR78_08090, partial [Spirochaetia bacterium]|nr:hypothetical protein [Spirochaetia bacterium]